MKQTITYLCGRNVPNTFVAKNCMNTGFPFHGETEVSRLHDLLQFEYQFFAVLLPACKFQIKNRYSHWAQLFEQLYCPESEIRFNRFSCSNMRQIMCFSNSPFSFVQWSAVNRYQSFCTVRAPAKDILYMTLPGLWMSLVRSMGSI